MPVTKSPIITSWHPDIQAAYAVLQGKPLSRNLAYRLAHLGKSQVLDLVALANKVKNRFAPEWHVCTIMNAKSGACPEDCKFCAQSSYHAADIATYPLVSQEKILAACQQAYQSGVRHFGLVTSGTGYDQLNPEFQSLLAAIRQIHIHYPDLEVCASCGILNPVTAQALAEAGVVNYNLNLQVGSARYAQLVATTHTWEKRAQTVQWLKAAGIRACVGGIIGLGESMEDRLELAFALQDLEVDIIPLNVLIPIPGTALENQAPVYAWEVAQTLALFRLLHPTKVIKLAAGRETRMKDFQGLLLLSGVNGFLTGGYLTTRGREIAEDLALLRELEAFIPEAPLGSL